MPPTRSESVGLAIRFSSVLPCAVPTSWTPRSAMVRAAAASSSVPISSMTITSGMWFSTPSIITACCSVGVRTCIRRASPIPGCGMSPSGDLVAGVDDNHALAQVVGEDARDLAQHGGFADAGTAEQQDALPALHDVANDVDGPVDSAADAAGQAHHLAGAIADGADPMEGAFDPGPVVVAERTDVVDDVGDIRLHDLAIEEYLFGLREARLGTAAEVH